MSLPILPPLIQDEALSLTEKVYRTLKAGILEFAIKPREYLVIGEVSEHYGLSRTPVREALILLEREGWVQNDGRRGAKVTVPSVDALLQVIEIQAVLESYIARRAAQLLTDDDLRQIEQILNDADKEMRTGNHELSRKLGVQFHEKLAEVAGNPRMRAEIVALEQHIDRVRPLIWQQGKAPIDISAKQHRAIFKALKARDEAKAAQLMHSHTDWFESELATALKHL